MNNKLLNKLNKLTKIAQQNDNILLRSVIIDEIYKNKDLQTPTQVNNAMNYLKEHNIKVIDSDKESSEIEEGTNNSEEFIDNNSEPIINTEINEDTTSNNKIKSDINIFSSKMDIILDIAKQNDNSIKDSEIINIFKDNLNIIDNANTMTKIFEYLESNDIKVISEANDYVDDELDEEDSDDFDEDFEQLDDLEEPEILEDLSDIEDENFNEDDTELDDEDDLEDDIDASTKRRRKVDCSDSFSEDLFRSYVIDMYNNSTDLLSSEEEKELSRAAKNGDKAAHDKMVTSNLKLVISIAKKFIGCGLDMSDLVQEGNIGLLTAIDRFNPDLDYKFSTYATWWIRQAITRALANSSRVIKLPVHAVEQARFNTRAMAILNEQLGRIPTFEEIADYVNEHKMFASSSISQVTPESVQLYAQFYKPGSVKSLYTPVGEEEHGEESYIGDFIEDTKANVEEIVMRSELTTIMNDVLENVLSEKEADIIRLRFGIGYDTCLTLEEVGKKYNVTRERIRQIEAKAMKKIKRSVYARQKLAGFSNNIHLPWLR